LQDDQGSLLVSEDDLKVWNILPPKIEPITYFGTRYYPFSAFKGGTFTVNKLKSTIDINVPASLMKANLLEATPNQFKVPTKPNLGAYLNYDLLGQAVFDSSQQQEVGGVFTPGIFTKYGNLTDNFVVQGTSDKMTGSETTYTRLNTTWETDIPANMQTLRLGDTYNIPGMWGRSTNFGGIQWGTNFSTQPNFLTFPMISAKGEATVPTAVDLYVNNTLTSQNNVNAGPFSVTNIPTVNGAGMVNVVTTDVLGRQQVISVPYYTSTSLLKKGLQNYSVETGFIRQNYGTESNDYGDFMAVATYSRGLTNNFTPEIHAEVLADHQTLGLGGTYLLSTLGVVNLAVAGSTSKDGAGGLVLAGFQRQSQISDISFGFNVQATTPDFKQVGYDDDNTDQLPPSLQEQIFFSFPIGKASFGLSYTQQNNRGSEDVNLLSLSYSQSFFKSFSVNVSAFTNVYGSSNKALMFTIVKAFTDRTYASVGGNVQKDNNSGTVQLTRSLPTDTGYGYNLVATPGENPNYLASFSEQTSFGTYTATTEYQNDNTGVKLEANGGIVVLDKSAFLTRSIYSSESFAVVEVPGMPEVTVYKNNAPYTKTDSNGKAVITDLLPYQENKIAIEPNDLPLNSTLGASELNVIPYSNSGLVVKFPVRLSQSATMTLINAVNNQPLPMGTAVTLVGAQSQEQFMVANDGELYITDLAATNVLRAEWEGGKCTAQVSYKKSADPLPDLGTVMCR
jgi:outer membrane usher protein